MMNDKGIKDHSGFASPPLSPPSSMPRVNWNATITTKNESSKQIEDLWNQISCKFEIVNQIG